MKTTPSGIIFRIVMVLALTMSALLAVTVPALAAGLPTASFSGIGIAGGPATIVGSGTQTIGAGETVQFSGSATNAPITVWAWTFGDGGTSDVQSPSHVYAAAGTYTVTLTATNSTGTGATLTKTNYITVLASMSHTVDLSLTPASQDVLGPPTSPTFTLTIRVSPTTTGQAVAAVDAFLDFDSTKFQVNSVAVAPGSLFNQDFTPTDPDTGLPIYFDNSAGTIQYSGGKLSPFPSTAFNMAVVTMHATAEATNSPITFATAEPDPFRNSKAAYGGTDITGTRTGATVSVQIAPTANFTGVGAVSGTQTVAAGETVNFTDTTTGTATSWDWDFDTSTPSTDSTVQNPTHVYTVAGTYSVRLTATNAVGSDTITKNSYITVVAGALDHITIAGALGVPVGGSQTYTSTTYDVYGNARTGDPIVWSLAIPAAGSINATTGLFNATTVAGTYTNAIVATSGAVTGHATVVVDVGALDHMTISPDSPSLVVGGAQTFSLTGYDSYNNVRPADGPVWSVSNPTAGTINASTGAFTAGHVAGTYTNVIVATCSTPSGPVTATTSVTVTPGTLDHITVSPASPSVAVNGSQTFTATTYDQYNNVRTGDTIAWSVSNADRRQHRRRHGRVHGGYGGRKLSNVIVATSGAVTGHASVTVTAGALDHITIAGALGVPVGGSQTYTATTYDVYGNARTGDPIVWSLAIPAAGSINATTGLFNATTVAGTYTNAIVATSGAVTGHATVVVDVGALDHMTISPDSPSLVVGGAQTFSLTGYDSYNNVRPADGPVWSLANPTAGSINASTGAFTAGHVAGTYTDVIVATCSTPSGPVTATTSVTVTPGTLDHITIAGALGVPVGGSQTYTATTYDVYGNARTGDPIVWSLAIPAAGSINATTGLFNATTVAGTYTNAIVATSGAVTGHATVVVDVGALDHMTISPDSPSLVVGGAQTFSLTGYDSYNNVRPADGPVWSLANPTAGSINASTGAFTAGHVAGTYTNVIVATCSTPSGPVTATTSVTVTVGPLDHITVSPASPSVAVNGSQTFTATTYDQYNNARTGDTIAWIVSNPTAGGIDAGTGAFTAGTLAGSYSNVIVATSGAVTGRASVTVTAGALAQITIHGVLGVPVAGGQTYTVTTYDQYGNARTGDPIVWSVADPTAGSINPTTGAFTASHLAGTYTNAIVATSGAVSGHTTVVLDVGALDHMTISPAGPSLVVGGAQTFSLTGYDLYNNVRPADGPVWSVSNPTAGSINASTGAFTAGHVAGTYTDVIVATCSTPSGPVTATTSVTVTPGTLDHITVSPANPSIAVDGSQAFTATTYDQYDNPRSGDTIAWSVTNPTAGGINASTGILTAGTVTGSYPNVVVATSGAVSGNASVTVVAGALDHITVSPASPTVAQGHSVTFSAQSYDQYNNLRPGDTFAWSVTNPTAGSINASTGAFTAGTTNGTYSSVISAVSGATTGYQSVIVRSVVTISLDPGVAAPVAVLVGQEFPVTVKIASGSQQVSAVDAFVNYDPAVLEITNLVQAGTTLPTMLANTYDNDLGEAVYSASKTTAPYPSGNFTLATITFRPKTTAVSTSISFNFSGDRTTQAAYSGNNYLDENQSTSATVTYDVPVSITGAPASVDMMTDFTANITINAGAASVDATSVYLTFDPTYIKVNSIADGAFGTVTTSTYDNVTGQLTYVASNGAPLTGTITVATVHFEGKAVTSGTDVTFTFADPRKTSVTFGGIVVPGTHGPGIVGLVLTPGGILNGTVTLQGGQRPAAGRTIPLTVKLFPVNPSRTNTDFFNGTGATATHVPTTVNGGTNTVTFQIAGIVPGSYDITVMAGHTLMSVKKNVAIAGPTSVNFGTLLEGNCNNDMQINAIDFSTLASSYLKSTGQAGFNSSADFDMSGQVNSIDFSLLAANYLKGVQTVS